MVNKKILALLGCCSLGVIIGSISGWFLGQVAKPVKEVIYKKPCYLNVVNDDLLGEVTYVNSESLPNEELSFYVNLKNEDTIISYAEINGKKYLTNSDNYFSFPAKEGENLVEIFYVPRDPNKTGCSIEIDSSIINGSVSLSQNKQLKNFYVSIYPKANEGYILDSIVINEEYYVSLNLKKIFEFKTLFLKNSVFCSFIKEGNSVDYAIDEFNSYIEGKDITSIDFSKEEVINKFGYGSLARISFSRLSSITAYVSKGYNFANSITFSNLQHTNTTTYKNSLGYFKENITFSNNIQMAERMYSEPGSINYFITSGKENVPSVDIAHFDENSGKKYDNKDFILKFGSYPFDPIDYLFYNSYVVDEKVTIDNETFNNQLELIDNFYYLTIVLDANASYNHAKYMYTTTNFDGAPSIAKQSALPIYNQLAIKIKLNREFIPVAYITRENYDVQALLKVNTIGKGKTTFTFVEKALPTFSDKVDYSSSFGDLEL